MAVTALHQRTLPLDRMKERCADMASIAAKTAKAFGLTDEAWLRHANLWSVCTRIPIPPAFALAVWSRTWIGRWSLIPTGAVGLWTWVNPRAFPPARSLDNWASKAVLGERLWSDPEAASVARRHQRAVKMLTAVNALGLPLIVWGSWALKGRVLVTGLVVQGLGKLWTLDRIVWFYEDVARERPDLTARAEGLA